MKNSYLSPSLGHLYVLPILFSLLSLTPIAARSDSSETTAPTEATELQALPDAATGNLKVAEVEVPADLWIRIRRGFAMPDLQVDLVQDREQW